MSRIVIKDVARRAGVSSATVSRVLNAGHGVSADRRARVVQAVSELGYQPNRVARNLRRSLTETIGVIVSDIENPHFTRAVRVMEDAAFAEGYRVFLCNTDETLAKQSAYLEMLAAEQVVGIILVPADPGDKTIRQVLDMDLPIVAFDREVNDPRADAVTADNAAAGQHATELLLAEGHTAIGFIAGRPDVQTGADRQLGYERAMARRGLESYAGNGMFRIEEAGQATRQILDLYPDTTALVVGNNLMTVGTLAALREEGVSVPGQISLIQLDDPFWAQFVDPPLTSFAQPVASMAQKAIDLLLRRVHNEHTVAQHVVYQFEPRLRRSTRPTGVTERASV